MQSMDSTGWLKMPASKLSLPIHPSQVPMPCTFSFARQRFCQTWLACSALGHRSSLPASKKQSFSNEIQTKTFGTISRREARVWSVWRLGAAHHRGCWRPGFQGRILHTQVMTRRCMCSWHETQMHLLPTEHGAGHRDLFTRPGLKQQREILRYHYMWLHKKLFLFDERVKWHTQSQQMATAIWLPPTTSHRKLWQIQAFLWIVLTALNSLNVEVPLCPAWGPPPHSLH